MKRSRKSTFLIITVALLATACGSGGDPLVEAQTPGPNAPPNIQEPTVDAPGDPVSPAPADQTVTAVDETTAPDTDDTSPPTTGDTSTVPDADAEVIFAYFRAGGFTTLDVALSEFPQLVVMSNGTVYRAGVEATAVFSGRPLQADIERLELEAEALASITTATNDTGGELAATDFGHTFVADAPTTTVWARVETGELIPLEAAALGFEDASNPAAEVRAQLSRLIEEVTAIVDAAAGTAEIIKPLRLAVLTFPSLTFEENATVIPWPIETVPVDVGAGTGCVVIEGDDVTLVWDAAANATTRTAWDFGSEIAAVAFRPVFPHEDFC